MEKEVVENVTEKEPTKSLVEQVKDLKENSVSKEEYAKLEETNKELMAALIDGKQVDTNQPEAEKVDIFGLVKEMREMDNTSLDIDYCKKALEYRNAVIEQYGDENDPFCPTQARFTPTSEDKEKAQNVADVMQQCIEEANGNNAVFIALMQERTRDVRLPKKK